MTDIPFTEHILGLVLGTIVTYFFRNISTTLRDLKEDVGDIHFTLARYESMDRDISEMQSDIKNLSTHSSDLQASVAVLEARTDSVIQNHKK